MIFRRLLLGKYVVTALVVALICSLRYIYLCTQESILGWDTMYYFVQIKALHQTASMHSPEPSLIYPFLFGLFRWSQGDYLMMYRLGVSVISTLIICLSAFYAYTRTRRSEFALVIGAWAMWSTSLWWFTMQYPKNALGLIWFLLVAIATAEVKPRYVAILIGCILAWFTHQLAFFLAIIWLFLWVLLRYSRAFFVGAPSANSISQTLRLRTLTFSLLALSAAFAFSVMRFEIFNRFASAFTSDPTWAALAMLEYLKQTGGLSAWWMAEIVLYSGMLVGLCIGIFAKQGRRLHAVLMVIFFGLLAFPFFEFHEQSLGFRMISAGFCLSPILLTESAALLLPESKRSAYHYWIAVFLVCTIIPTWSSFKQKHYGPHIQEYALVSKWILEGIQNLEERPCLIIAPKGWAEGITFFAGIDAMPWLPEYPIAPSKLWRLAQGISSKEYALYLGKGETKDMKIKQLALIKESDWQSAIIQAKERNDLHFLEQALHERNPSRQRPQWLLKRKQ